jgi:hypothetical protein
VSSLRLTLDKSLSISNAVISPQVALPTTFCSATVNASGVLSVSAFKIVLASYIALVTNQSVTSFTALLVGTVVSSEPNVVTIVLELFLSVLPLNQENKAISLSTELAGQLTSQPPADDIAALTAASVGTFVSAHGLHTLVTNHKPSLSVLLLAPSH